VEAGVGGHRFIRLELRLEAIAALRLETVAFRLEVRGHHS